MGYKETVRDFDRTILLTVNSLLETQAKASWEARDGEVKAAEEKGFEVGREQGEKEGIRKLVDYFSRQWMGAAKGMLIYEISDKDRDLLEEGIVPSSKKEGQGINKEVGND